MADKGLDNLFYDTLRDVLYAERHILKTLPTLAQSASSDELKAAFKTHHGETEGQITRLETVFGMIDRKPTSKRCEAIDGILKEGEGVLEDYKDTSALDAVLISSAQAVEHYEITRYGTLKRWAEVLGMSDVAKLLDATLQDEAKTDEALTALADASANQQAVAAE